MKINSTKEAAKELEAQEKQVQPMQALSDDELDLATGGVGTVAYDGGDGKINIAVCNKAQVSEAVFYSCIRDNHACSYYNPKPGSVGAHTCYQCQHISYWASGATVQY